MKKLTKIDKQRIEFLNNIDFSYWKESNDNIHDFPDYNYPKIFNRYHDVMFDYYTRKSDEEFVKKWWLAMIHKNLRRDINLDEDLVTNQRAYFTINWGLAAHRIVNQAKNKMYWLFFHIEKNET